MKRQVIRFKDPNGFSSDMLDEVREAVAFALGDDSALRINGATSIRIEIKVKTAPEGK